MQSGISLLTHSSFWLAGGLRCEQGVALGTIMHRAFEYGQPEAAPGL